ncbi:MAG: hypothetical protein SFU98_12580 [Leptospiraceae bacterium]|nr:hypothetical protein [Leptospiraceae bacterium]
MNKIKIILMIILALSNFSCISKQNISITQGKAYEKKSKFILTNSYYWTSGYEIDENQICSGNQRLLHLSITGEPFSCIYSLTLICIYKIDFYCGEKD